MTHPMKRLHITKEQESSEQPAGERAEAKCSKALEELNPQPAE